MKNIRKELIASIIICLFVIGGIISLTFVMLVVGAPKRVVSGDHGVIEEIDYINSQIGERLRYHDELMDFYSLIMRYTGTRIVEKEDSIIVVSSNGMLSCESGRIDCNEIETIANRVFELQTFANRNDADFLYVYAPNKNAFLSFPDGVDNYSNENHIEYIDALRRLNVNVLDLQEEMECEQIIGSDSFFITDHHWKPECGFWANGKICEELNKEYGFKYDSKYTTIENYEQKVYNDWFLGSYGKKVGKYFSPLGLDEITLITPKFDTSMVEKQPAKDEIKIGPFTDTVMDLSLIESKSLYELNPYAAYSGGDFRLQIIENQLAENEKRILVVRDSFACTVTPFLALNCNELHIVDIRNFEYYVGSRIELEQYIQEIKPDYVIVLYSGVDSFDSDGRFDFFNNNH